MLDGCSLLEAEQAKRKALRWRASWHARSAGRNKSNLGGTFNMKTVEQDVAGNYVGDRRRGA